MALIVLVNLRVGLSYTPSNMALMSVMYVLSALPFFAGGAAISIAISRLTTSVNAVYAADLLGAGAGCLLLMPALNSSALPAQSWRRPASGSRHRSASPIPKCAAATWSGHRARTRGPPAAVGGLFSVSTTKGHENHRVLFSKWNSFSRIGVYEASSGAWSLSGRYTGPLPDVRLMDIDSAAATQILKFSGDLKDMSYLSTS